MEEKKENEKTNQVNFNNKISIIINLTTKTILNFIYLVLIIITIILIYNIIQVGILGKPYMEIFGYSFFQVKTGSMSGAIETGDIIIVKLTKDVKQNDIITYQKDKMLITHRIIQKQDDTITTKGDANNTADEPITTSEVIGKVVYTFKNIQIWKKVFKEPKVYTLIIITLMLFGITFSIKDKKDK